MAETSSVSFDHSIYDQASIETAAATYAGFLEISVAAGDGETTASFSNLDPEQGQMLVDAFCNHVLFETIQRFRATEVSA
jgi:hypothetical protein